MVRLGLPVKFHSKAVVPMRPWTLERHPGQVHMAMLKKNSPGYIFTDTYLAMMQLTISHRTR